MRALPCWHTHTHTACRSRQTRPPCAAGATTHLVHILSPAWQVGPKGTGADSMLCQTQGPWPKGHGPTAGMLYLPGTSRRSCTCACEPAETHRLQPLQGPLPMTVAPAWRATASSESATITRRARATPAPRQPPVTPPLASPGEGRQPPPQLQPEGSTWNVWSVRNSCIAGLGLFCSPMLALLPTPVDVHTAEHHPLHLPPLN